MTTFQTIPQSFIVLPLLASTALLFAALLLDELLLHVASRRRPRLPRFANVNANPQVLPFASRKPAARRK